MTYLCHCVICLENWSPVYTRALDWSTVHATLTGAVWTRSHSPERQFTGLRTVLLTRCLPLYLRTVPWYRVNSGEDTASVRMTVKKMQLLVGTRQPGNRGSIPSRRKTFFSSPKRPDRLWVTLRHQLTETGGSLHWSKMAGVWNSLHNSI
jgi:hypothetical protein